MKRRAAVVAAIAAVIAAWVMFGPTQFGGGTSYVTTHGNSMEPGIHAGDLAVVRSAGSYQVGDAVAYHSPSLHTVVLHRIVGVKDGLYTFKGDHNSWLDPELPNQEGLVGRLWFTIPQGGVWLERLTSPAVLATFAFLLLIAGGAAEQKTRRSRKRRHPMKNDSGGSLRWQPWWFAQPSAIRAAVWACGVTLVLGLLLALVAWSRPTTVPATASSAAATKMVFSYSAAVPRSAAYQTATAQSPSPIFRKLANQVDVTYSYSGPGGTVGVVAQLSTSSGWNWTVPLAAPAKFAGTNHTGTVSLNLNDLMARAQAGAKASGIPAGSVDVAVVPAVISGGGKFEPALKMILAPQSLTLAGDPDTLVVTGAGASTMGTAANTINLLVMSLSVASARLLSLILLGLGLLGALITARFARQAQPLSASEEMELKYGSILLPVDPMPAPLGAMVDVPNIAELAKLARSYGLLIMHGKVNGADVYMAQDEHVAYCLLTHKWTLDPDVLAQWAADAGHAPQAG